MIYSTRMASNRPGGTGKNMSNSGSIYSSGTEMNQASATVHQLLCKELKLSTSVVLNPQTTR